MDDDTVKLDTVKVVHEKFPDEMTSFQRCYYIRYNAFKYVSTDVCITIDANTRILKSLDPLYQKFTDGGYDFALMPHPFRDNFLDELEAWLTYKESYDPEFARRTFQFLKTARYNLNYRSLVQLSFTIKRRCKTTFDLDRMTYALLNLFGADEMSIDKNDQIAFSFVLNRYFSHCKVLPLSEQIVQSDYLCACLHGTDEPMDRKYFPFYFYDRDYDKDIKYLFNKEVTCITLK